MERNAIASPNHSQTDITNRTATTAAPNVPLVFTPAPITTPNTPPAINRQTTAPPTPGTPNGTPPSHDHQGQNTPTGTNVLPSPPPKPSTQPNNSSPGTEPAADTTLNNVGAQNVSEEEEENEIASLLKSLGEQSSLADLENAFGAFSLIATPFSEIKIPMDVDEPMSSSRKVKGTQWIKLTQTECTQMMLHKSGNPHDFIADTTLEECKKAIRGEKHKLGNTKAILVDPGYKMIVRIVHRNCPHAKHQQWIKHAVRSALASAESPLEGAMSIIAMGKPSYDWHVISLTKDAYDALQEIRALFDPRSRVLVLLRLWKMEPETTQILNFTGVVTDDDLSETARSTATALFKAQLESTLSPYGITIETMEAAPNPRNPISAPITCVTFKLTGATVFTLNPKDLPKAYNGPGNRQRTITPSWPRRCPICHSEAHLGEKCPWITKEFNGATYAPYNANNLSPGQTERAPKRKREDTETTLPGTTTLTDIRPISRAPKMRKTEAPTAMDIDQPSTPTPPPAPTSDNTMASAASPTALTTPTATMATATPSAN